MHCFVENLEKENRIRDNKMYPYLHHLATIISINSLATLFSQEIKAFCEYFLIPLAVQVCEGWLEVGSASFYYTYGEIKIANSLTCSKSL